MTKLYKFVCEKIIPFEIFKLLVPVSQNIEIEIPSQFSILP